MKKSYLQIVSAEWPSRVIHDCLPPLETRERPILRRGTGMNGFLVSVFILGNAYKARVTEPTRERAGCNYIATQLAQQSVKFLIKPIMTADSAKRLSRRATLVWR